MSTPSGSYLKVHYELRPAKQVERRMLVDALQELSADGFAIKHYKYTGMGSVYFIDFMLFHRLLGISDMLSVEIDPRIEKRVEFNKPFKCVDTKIASMGEIIPTLSQKKKHLLWLDYDSCTDESHLEDVTLAATYLTPGSILLVTVDIEPPETDDDDNSPHAWMRYFRKEAADYFDASFTPKDFRESILYKRNIEFIEKAIRAGITGRSGIEFIPMFNFIYKDGHKMLTMGCMIGTSIEKQQLLGSYLAKAKYFRKSFELPPCVIQVPRLTRKERQYLDGFMPCKSTWMPTDFELSKDSVKAYRDIYRFCPTFAELLI